MLEYNFENLDDKLFEHLAVALGQFHVARGLRPFGPGPDGGREATFEGRMDYPSKSERWDGYLVIQCKHKERRGATPKDEADWAIEQLDAEMEKYRSAKVSRRLPEYFLFITNAELSAKPNVGGKDRFVARLRFWIGELGLRDADVWDREKLSSLLNGTQAVAQRFGLLHAGDLIHHAAQAVLSHRQGVETTLSVFLQEELRTDQYVRLAQAGHVGDERTPLARVFVDLRATVAADGTEAYAVEAIQRASDRPVYPSLIENERQVQSNGQENFISYFSPVWVDPSRYVFVGGPGQGKSTLVQHVAQRHRAALLSRHASSSLGYETRLAIRAVKAGADASGIGLPSHPRLPFRIVLEQFADALAKGQTTSVLDFVASLVRKRSARPFDRDDAERLLREIPWLVAFDGLDEVPAVSNRAEVMGAVRRFIGEAQSLDADLVVLATTRPQGYEDEFSPQIFNHLYLAPLSKDEALNYARKFVETKYIGDADRRERVIKRLEAAAAEEATAKLMVSPLQVTMMAALVDLVGNPPRERYPLFSRYYDVVYQREQERGLGSSQVLAEHQNDINALHDRAGLLLQISTETAGKTEARLSGAELRSLVCERLMSVGYEGSDLQQIADSLVEVAVNRLVFIVPLEEDRYGFEVRSLQEFAAARALMRRGSPEQVKHRLLAVAPAPYWRNTVLFAVGLVFAEREDLSDTIAQLCRELNEDEQAPVLFHSRAGSRLALDILDDGAVDRRPIHRRSLLETALLLLDSADLNVSTRLAALYRPEDEARYIAAARSAVSRNFGDGAGVYILLASLAKAEVSWAEPLLRELWPADIEHMRWAFEHVAGLLTWEEWQVALAVQVARESDPDWVGQNLSDHLNIPWIQDARNLRWDRGGTLNIYLDADPELIAYILPAASPSEEVLNRIAEASPMHSAWVPYIVAREFILNPNPLSLAEVLCRFAELPTLKHARVAHLPWPLLSVLRYAESPEELISFAARARAGLLGDVDTWAAAESRWERDGFEIEDWAAFDESEVPFNQAIVEHGVVAFGARITHSVDAVEQSVRRLRLAFSIARTSHARRRIASDLSLCLGVLGEYEYTPDSMSITELAEISMLSRWGVRPTAFNAVYDPSQDLFADSVQVEQIGLRTGLSGGARRAASRGQQRARKDTISLVAAKIADALTRKGPSDGLVRLLAGIALMGGTVPPVAVNPGALTPEGRIALVALSLFGDEATSLSPTDAARMILEFHDHVSPVTQRREIRDIVSLAATPPISSYSVEVFDLLLRGYQIDRDLAKAIVDGLHSATKYRTSNLGDAGIRVSLGL